MRGERGGGDSAAGSVSVSWCPGHIMGPIITLLPLLLRWSGEKSVAVNNIMIQTIICFSSQADVRTLVKRSSPDVITGRGFAAPPKLNIETYSSPGSQGPSYYSDNLTGGQGQYDYYSEERDREPYLPPAEYPQNYQYEDISGHYQRPQTYQSSSYLPSSDYDRLKDKLYTNDQLRSYIKDLRQQINNYENIVPHNHERGTKVDLSRYHHNDPYPKRY